MVLKNLFSPCFHHSFSPPKSQVKGKKGKDGNKREINEWRRRKKTDFPFNFYIVISRSLLHLSLNQVELALKMQLLIHAHLNPCTNSTLFE